MGAYVDVSDATFDAEVLQSEIPVLVDFWAPWCGPCRMLAPHLEVIAKEYAGRVKVAKVNVDNNQSYAARYGVQGIPKMIVFKGGAQVADITGLPRNPVDTLRALVNQAL